MKKSTNKILMIVLSIVMLFSLAIGIGCDCGDNGTTGGGGLEPIKKTATVTFSKTSEKLIVGDYLTVVAYTNKVLDEEVVFESENESVATVDERGKIEAINAGTTNIVAKYGDATAKCAITVEWDNSYPTLIDLNGMESSYSVYANSLFEFQPAISYRGRIYYDANFTFMSTDDDVVTFEGNVLKAGAKAGNVANCYVEASWRGFDSSSAPLLRCDFAVNIRNEAYITLKGTSEDFIKLYTREEFEGNQYINSSAVIPEFYANGEKVEIEFDKVIENDSLITYENNVVTAKKFGETTLEISCEYEGEKFVKSIAIEIQRPIADYEMEIGKFSSGVGTFKDVDDNLNEKTIAEKIYGNNDVTIIEAYQGDEKLSIENNKIFGVSGANDDVYRTVVTIGTDTEIYNVPLEVYGLYITKAEDLDFFYVNGSLPNYYYLANDIDASSFEFTQPSTSCNCITGLLGTFEGNGHVISNLTTKTCGLFGIVQGATIQNVAFTNVTLTGYYPCLIGHKEAGATTLKNIYAEINSIAARGGALYQQTLSASGTHENIVVVYGISQDEVRTVMTKTDKKANNQCNISTFAPNRATLYKDTTFKNCFSISYAPVGCSEPKGTDYSWSSHLVAENQVIQGEAGEDGKIPLTGVTDWDKEMLASTTTADFLKTKVGTASENTGTDVLKGVRAYQTFADLVNDKENNETILSTFDKNYWIVVDGVPVWKGIYVNTFSVSVKNGEVPVEDKIILSDDTTELTISIVDENGVPVETTIANVEGVVVNGNKVKLASYPTSKGSYEIVATAIVDGLVIEKVVTINYSNELEIVGKVLYSDDDKSLDLYSLNKALIAAGVEPIELSDIDSYKVNGEESNVLDLEVIISNNTSVNFGGNRTVDVAQVVTLIVEGKTIILNNVYAYTKVINEAEDLNYFVMDGVREYNEVDGYFVLAKNIDASGLELNNHVYEGNSVLFPGDGYNLDVGFRGVFDGQGYTIDGLTVKSNGLFGSGNAPVIKNVAFTNVNLTGYYESLFFHNILRGKDYNNGFNGYEGMISNVYISIASVAKGGSQRVGVLANNTLPAAVKLENVIVEYANVSSDIQAQIDAGKSFYMFGSSTLSMASSTSTYKNCYAISTAPVLSLAKMPGFAENQVEFTLENNKVTAVGNVLDEQVTKILALHGKTLAVDHVIVGLRAYANYEAMKLDAEVNATSLATFNSAYWTIVDGVPTWNTANA